MSTDSNSLKNTIMVLGSTDGVSTGVWEYHVDPIQDSWQKIETQGAFVMRAYFSSAILNGKLYTFGGTGWESSIIAWRNKFEAYDLSTKTWSIPRTDGGFTSRNQLTISILGNTVYAIGGLDTNGRYNTNQAFQESPLAVSPYTDQAPLRLYPNPCSISVMISGLPIKPLSVDIYDVLGRKCLIARRSIDTKSFDVSQLPSGTYVARISSSSGQESHLLIKQ